MVLSDATETVPLYLKKHFTIIVGCYDGKLYSLDSITGKVIWKYSAGDRIRSTPILCSNEKFVLLGSYDKHVHCINCEVILYLHYKAYTSNLFCFLEWCFNLEKKRQRKYYVHKSF